MSNSPSTTCEWTPVDTLTISGDVWSALVQYAHLVPAVAVLIIAFFVFWHNPHNRPQQAFLAVGVSFAAWAFLQLLSIIGEPNALALFASSSVIYFELLVYISALFFVYAYIDNAWPSSWTYFTCFLLFIPLFLFSHTPLNIVPGPTQQCWPQTVPDGPLWYFYVYLVLFALFLWMVTKFIMAYQQHARADARYRYLVLGTALTTVLAVVSGKHITLLLELDAMWLLLAIFLVPLAVVAITFQIVEFESRNAKVIATEAVLFGIGILLLSLLFVDHMSDVALIAGLAFVLLLILGMLFVDLIRHEIHQQTEIEKLLKGLSRANRKLSTMDKQKSEFVSIASHQLRSPLTAIRGYASMLLEGSFGKFPQKAKKPLAHIEESAGMMALSIEDYLNVSRIESGNMKYDYTDFNLLDLTTHVCDDLRSEATRAGLLLLCKDDLSVQPIVHADKGKVQQILHNLLHNALKYTPKGTITVYVHDGDDQMINVEIIDTGIGMSEETQHSIFQKFERASAAQSINVQGTGLGLYVAKRMAQVMGGDITGYSDGEGKGSHFILSLPRKL